MQTYRFRLHAKTAFGTPLAGDTLFGQLCWTLRHQHGEERLNKLLENYCAGQPFLVMSDAFPAGYLPLPTLPSRYWKHDGKDDRKALKKKRWCALSDTLKPLAQWQIYAINDSELNQSGLPYSQQCQQPHNTIDRITGTTGTGQFAPYQMAQTWFAPDQTFDLYAVIDESKLSLAELQSALTMVGQTGYGRDASIGLGKFSLAADACTHQWHSQRDATSRHWLTLAPCAPHSLALDSRTSYYQIHTRFGRHGDAAALGANPFKQPLLMAKSAAVFADKQSGENRLFIGQGIAGISLAHTNAVHQGYAPVLPVTLLEDIA